MPDYTLILTNKYQGAEWVLNGEDYEGLIWLSDTPKPSKEELDSQWTSVKSQIEKTKKDLETQKANLLAKLGITADEAALLLA
jgi:hypothetical protein